MAETSADFLVTALVYASLGAKSDAPIIKGIKKARKIREGVKTLLD